MPALSHIVFEPAGLARHAALAETFLDLGELVQGLADAEFEAAGRDDDTPLQRAAAAALMSLARPLAASWGSGFAGAVPVDPAPLKTLAAHGAPDRVTVKAPEGYAFYAVYPEAYAVAAARLAKPAAVIGLRSIGTSLAAMAAAGSGAANPVTVRPTGHPFGRSLQLSPALQARLVQPDGDIVVADEGPGLSGSAFGGVADWLEDHGVAPGRIVFMPSHEGAPGPMASDRHRRRWDRARKAVVTFDRLTGDAGWPAGRLGAWVEDLTGPAIEPLQDLSGGAWRRVGCAADEAWPPAYPGQERRKFLLRSQAGAFLLKFAGLGRRGRETFERALALGDAGLAPRPLGFRHGFLVEPWVRGRTPSPRDPALVPVLARYLAFRAGAFPATARDGAGLPALRAMVEANASEALDSAAGRRLAEAIPDHLPLKAIRIDGRLHCWEWRATADGRWLKTDAVDHHDAHDLVGCQDLAWDVAGAELEWELSSGQAQALAECLGRAGRPLRPEVLAAMRIAYPAFQLGLWTQAAAASGEAEAVRIAPLVDRYRNRLEALAS